MTEPSITTHVLDVARGRPARSIPVRLAWREGDVWREIGAGVTDENGRLDALPRGEPLRAGVYRLLFDMAGYLRESHDAAFYPEVTIVFEVSDKGEHHHVPLLLSPFGYATYRGS